MLSFSLSPRTFQPTGLSLLIRTVWIRHIYYYNFFELLSFVYVLVTNHHGKSLLIVSYIFSVIYCIHDENRISPFVWFWVYFFFLFLSSQYINLCVLFIYFLVIWIFFFNWFRSDGYCMYKKTLDFCFFFCQSGVGAPSNVRVSRPTKTLTRG